MELTWLTIKEANKGLRAKKFSSLELTKAVLDRIKTEDSRIQSYISVTAKEALSRAQKVDRLISDNQPIRFLGGIPLAVKDVISTKGLKTTAGSKLLENYNPAYNATVINKIASSSAVIVGKTNCDEFAMGSSTENSAYKKTKNPWDLGRVPGGSSGGSAAAVAADLCIWALGSDTGGSIRQPASLCGVVGFKPTYGRVSRYGLIAMSSSLDVIGPITKTVEDAAIVLEAIAGSDSQDATTKNVPVPSYTRFLNKSIKGIKVGVAREYFAQGIDASVGRVVKSAISKLEDLGANIIEISLPHQEYALAVYYIIVPSEVSSNMSRFDGIRYGRDRSFFGDEVKRRIMLGTYALSRGYYEQYYLKACRVRARLKQDFDEAFDPSADGVDVIVGPTSPTVAWKLGERASDPLLMYLSDIYTITANLVGIPAISVPCGLVGGLPVGLQIMGPQFKEARILNVAYQFEQVAGFKPKS